ncbi:peptidoglycan-associated lipoprotein Pal [Roseospira marina]|uniref:Peptidoglycan-associated lipoprotein n=1 Tax=Roseospira marina TaxID=140057 RepID=A0A5M6IGQ4_9PROT|nr:peptidoglycan-associated lipoprotein Pal [Roseospira marina]KAA5607486.1 peptidoglycan-associated lipoprotein Pal [Roseospira marina]MBB4312333.1 peptidoglycan-associated lipoprotein [Roseospira marina]MBB5085651.1 peptidoglycan-associated lipoprotein [Roseospira marina]
MKLKFISVVAASVLLAACSSTPESGSGQAGGGAAPVTAPSGPAAGSQQEFVQEVGDRIFFGFDSYNLDSQAQQTLRRQAAWLQQYGQYSATIEGHADERGTREYNLALGERRANAVRNYLVTLGVPSQRLSTVSYGKERPTCTEATESCWSRNRRGVTTLR